MKQHLYTTIAPLLRAIVVDSRALVRQELALAQHEITRNLVKTRRAALLLGVGIGLVLICTTLLSFMLVNLFGALFPELPLWGCFGIVALLVGAGAVVLLALGQSAAQSIQLLPIPVIVKTKEESSLNGEKPPKAKDSEELRRQIEKSQTALAKNFEYLGTEVEERIDLTADTVRNTVNNIKNTFDVEHQVQAHPWPWVGTSLVLGLAVGKLISPEVKSKLTNKASSFGNDQKARVAKNIGSRFNDELLQLKGVAVGLLFNTFQEMVKNSFHKSSTQSQQNGTEQKSFYK